MTGTADPVADLAEGDVLEVETRAMVHGGHCLAAAGHRTLFVRHALPGERVRVLVTEVLAKTARADAIEVLSASPHRVEPPCALSARCGGCDLQHADPAYQLDLKTSVLRESLARHARLDPSVVAGLQVEALEGPGQRTRMRWAIDADGRPCLHAHRSRDLIPIDDCPASASGIRAWLAGAPRLHGEQALTAEGDPVQVSVDGQVVAGPGRVPRRVRHRTWRIAADTFWQAHPALPDALVDSVLEFGRPASGEHWWDLYAGAGLFSAFLGEAVGPTGGVDAVEGSGSAVRDARRALHDLPWVRLHRQSVRSWMRHASGSPDGVVLDPPRSGAGAEVLGPLSALRPSRIILVACDPVALGRDVGLLADAGYRLERLRAFDAFAMTHHLEAVASLIASDGAHRLT